MKVVTVTYSHGGDLYRVAQDETVKKIWLSVQTMARPIPERVVPRTPFLGCVKSADGAGWRKAYSLDWSVVHPGRTVTLPENDPLVIDYAAAEIANG